MGEIIEALAYLYCGIFWLLMKGYEKVTGKDLGLLGALLALLLAGLLCAGVLTLLVSLLF